MLTGPHYSSDTRVILSDNVTAKHLQLLRLKMKYCMRDFVHIVHVFFQLYVVLSGCAQLKTTLTAICEALSILF